VVSVQGLIWPVIGGISSPFGMRRGRLHAGIDIRANRGTPILASQSGQVLISARRRAYGKVVVVGHDHDVQTLYAHLIKMIVRSGQYVEQGDVIGYVGRTGRATGYHLHFETRVAGGVPQDPMRSLPERPRVQARIETQPSSAAAAN
jgi:murein DD-endopeptidase MepM/ murein hydrolase activator NlpD